MLARRNCGGPTGWELCYMSRRFHKHGQARFTSPESQAALKEGKPKETEDMGVPAWRFNFAPQVDDTPYFDRYLAGGLTTSGLMVEKRLYGIPFQVNDAAALDCCMRHHRCAVRPVVVERFMMPFWLCCTNVCGTFKADVWQRDPTCITKRNKAWVQSPDYNFSYPLGDHFYYNQVSASYVVSNSSVEKTLCGNHVPSMLLERQELLEDLEAMATPPNMIPFDMTTETAIGIVSKNTSKERVEHLCKRELEKYHGKFVHAILTFWSLQAEATLIRPVYLPLYRIGICTNSNSKPVPTYVCGATGKTEGPVVHIEKKFRMWSGVGTGLTAAAITSIAFDSEIATIVGLAAAVGVQFVMSWYRYAEVLKALALENTEMAAMKHLHRDSNSVGYRWTVESEEKAQYEYREELRAKARRRADFQQRVHEETAREESMKAGRAYKAQRARATPRRKTTDPDPLSYYRILGLQGRETVTRTEIAKCFRVAAAKHHPDLCPEDKKEEAHLLMQRLLEAYSVLKDPKLRDEYDSGKLAAR